MKGDIECPRCHRMDFEWDSGRTCRQCHWTIRPEPVAQVFGCDVLLKKRHVWPEQFEERHYVGSEATARRRAKMRGEVLSVVPLSRETWVLAYGDPKIRL